MPLLSAYSAMTIQANGTESSPGTSATSYNYTESYNVVYHSSTTYKVDLVTLTEGVNISSTVWILNNGTAIAINEAGFNLTGSYLTPDTVVGLFAAFTLQIQADSYIGLYTSSNYFHATGTSTVMIGPTQVTVTTYQANTLPETVSGCGQTATLTAYSFSVGTPKGATVPLVTYEHFAGTSGTETYDYVLEVVSITLA